MSDDRLAAAGSDPPRRVAIRLLGQVIRHGGAWWALGLLFTSLALAAGELLLPLALGKAIDAALGPGGNDWIVWCAVIVGLMLVCDALDDLAAGLSSARGTAWLRNRLLRHVLALGARGSSRSSGGDLESRLVGNTADAGRIATLVVYAVAEALPAVGALVVLTLIDVWLGVALLIALPVLVPLVRTAVRDVAPAGRNYLEVQGRLAEGLASAVAGARTIAAAATRSREARRVLASLPRLHRAGRRVWQVQARVEGQGSALMPLIEVIVLGVAGVLLAENRISPGELVAAVQYAGLAAGIGAVTGVFAKLTLTVASAERIATVLDERPVGYGDAAPDGNGTLEFRGVTVRGPEGLALLDHVELAVPGGNSVVVVGRSGSGKSLLAAVAGRLRDPDEGVVLLDGVPMPDWSHDALRRAVGYGFERPHLVGRTVGDAIALNAENPDVDRLVSAAEAARAHAFVSRLPEGYRTALSETVFSGGEAQRLGLARAFAGGQRLLVLDDVAASLDTVTEHHIEEALSRSRERRTRLTVAHRVSTAAAADVVIWLDSGKIRAVGAHRALWEEPDYRAIFEIPVPEVVS